MHYSVAWNSKLVTKHEHGAEGLCLLSRTCFTSPLEDLSDGEYKNFWPITVKIFKE